MRDMKAASMMTFGAIINSRSLSMGSCLNGGWDLRPEEMRRAVVVKKVSHSNESSPTSEIRSSRGKMADSDKSDVLGGPLVVDSELRLGSCIICWTAASDNGENVDRCMRVVPHRSTAEEATDSIWLLPASGFSHRRYRYRRGSVPSPITADSTIERSLSKDSGEVENQNERIDNFGERKSR